MSVAYARIEPSPAGVEPQSSPGPARRRRKRLDPAVAITLFALLVLVAALLHVGQRARLAELTYELQQARLRLEQLRRIETQLLVEIERARSLSRVETEARLRLGMERPGSSRLVVVRHVETDDGSEAVQERRGPGAWLAALTEWYDHVSASVRAALSIPRWSQDGS